MDIFQLFHITQVPLQMLQALLSHHVAYSQDIVSHVSSSETNFPMYSISKNSVISMNILKIPVAIFLHILYNNLYPK